MKIDQSVWFSFPAMVSYLCQECTWHYSWRLLWCHPFEEAYILSSVLLLICLFLHSNLKWLPATYRPSQIYIKKESTLKLSDQAQDHLQTEMSYLQVDGTKASVAMRSRQMTINIHCIMKNISEARTLLWQSRQRGLCTLPVYELCSDALSEKDERR